MSSYAVSLIERFRAKGVLVDTNLLLLYTVGIYDQELLTNNRLSRLQSYDVSDYKLLQAVMGLFPVQVTTAHVLTEVSNWLGYLPDEHRSGVLSGFSDTFSNFLELTFSATEIGRHDRFRFLGLTDTALATVANDYLILTEDARFVWHLNQLNLEALNMNHLRQEAWLSE